MKLEDIGVFSIFFVENTFQIFSANKFVLETEHLDEAREFSFFEMESNMNPRFDW